MTQDKTPLPDNKWECIIYLAIWAVIITLLASKGLVKTAVVPLLVISALCNSLPNFSDEGKEEERQRAFAYLNNEDDGAIKQSSESRAKSSVMWLVLLATVVIMGWLKALIAALIIIGIIATVHEFGHYIASKAVGVRVDEFSVGLGSTKLWCKKIGETEYSLRPIPLGAFVKPAGMDPEEEYKEGDDPGERSFNKKGLIAKLSILFAGPIANIILTVMIMSGLYYVVGDRPTTIEVDKVLKGKPAAVAGIRSGDVFLEINGEKITDYIEGIDIIGRNAGKPIEVKINRPYDAGKEEPVYRSLMLQVVPELTEDGVGKIGMLVRPHIIDETFVPLSLGAACKKGLAKTLGYVAKMYQLTLKMFKRAFSKMEVPAQIGGPLKIANTIKDAVDERFDIREILSLTAWLSMSIGVFNLLPIPALDGGRILVLILGWLIKIGYLILRKPIPEEGVISPRFEEIVHFCGFAFLLLLLIIVSWKDIKDMISPPSMLERLKVKEEDCIDGAEKTSPTTGTISIPKAVKTTGPGQ